MGIDELRRAVEQVVEWHCGFVNGNDESEPYEPLANPGQFPACVVKLATWLREQEMNDDAEQQGVLF